MSPHRFSPLRRAWQSMRILREFDLGKIVATAEADESSVQLYILQLSRAGIIKKLADDPDSLHGTFTTYWLLHDLGPVEPRVETPGDVFDPNAGVYVYRAGKEPMLSSFINSEDARHLAAENARMRQENEDLKFRLGLTDKRLEDGELLGSWADAFDAGVQAAAAEKPSIANPFDEGTPIERVSHANWYAGFANETKRLGDLACLEYRKKCIDQLVAENLQLRIVVHGVLLPPQETEAKKHVMDLALLLMYLLEDSLAAKGFIAGLAVENSPTPFFEPTKLPNPFERTESDSYLFDRWEFGRELGDTFGSMMQNHCESGDEEDDDADGVD